MNIKEAFKSMSDDFKAKTKDIKDKEAFKKLIEDEKIELTPEQEEAIAGAAADNPLDICCFDCCDTFYK